MPLATVPEGERFDVLFFSRGRGRGHSIPDAILVERLMKQIEGLSLRFVSYGTGATTLKAKGYNIIDLGLRDDNPLIETIIRCVQVMSANRPRLVIAHEEFAALIAARAFDVPSVFITNWFVDPTNILMRTLSYSEEIIFIGEVISLV
jgi:hypothetical protein